MAHNSSAPSGSNLPYVLGGIAVLAVLAFFLFAGSGPEGGAPPADPAAGTTAPAPDAPLPETAPGAPTSGG